MAGVPASGINPGFQGITEAYQTICHSAQFINELRKSEEFQGRPTPSIIVAAVRMLGTTQIYLKREDLTHGRAQAQPLYGRGFAKVRGQEKDHSRDGRGTAALPWPPRRPAGRMRYLHGEVGIANRRNVARMKILRRR